MATTTLMPSQKRRQRARMDAVTPPPARNRVSTDAQSRRPLEALLTTAGWTRSDLHELRAVSTEHLCVLIACVPPDDVGTYVAWGRIAALTGLTSGGLRRLLAAHPDVSPTLMRDLIRHAQNYARNNMDRFNRESLLTPTQWATAHASAGNPVADAARFDYTTPAWLIAWLRTGHLPADVATVPVGENHLWAYIDAAAAYPDAPEAVLAVTVSRAPGRPAADGPLEEWLANAWADQTRSTLTAA